MKKPVTLRGVEHREALQEGDGLGFLAGFAGSLLLLVRNEAVGIDDRGAALALADVAAKAEGLPEGEPALAGEAVLDHGAPEDQHIDAGIASASGRVPRHRERRLRRRSAPRLDPGHTAGLQLGDDLASDFVIEVRPVGAGTSAAVMSGHRGSPQRAPGASLPTLNPSRQTGPHSPSKGALRGPPRRRGCAGDHGAGQGEGFPHQRVGWTKRRAAALTKIGISEQAEL